MIPQHANGYCAIIIFYRKGVKYEVHYYDFTDKIKEGGFILTLLITGGLYVFELD